VDQSSSIIDRIRAMRTVDTTPSEHMQAKHELAEAIRGLSQALLRTEASADALRAMTGQVRAHRDALAAAQRTRNAPYTGPTLAIQGMEDFRDRGPMTGLSNPLAAPLQIAPDPDARVVAGEVTFGPVFEGAPGCVHGGFVAAALDEALGMAYIFSGGPGMTGELTTRYLRHTPIDQPLRIEARLDSVDGRKIHTSGEVYLGDVVVAEGSGLFIAVDNEKFRRLAEAHAASKEV